MVDNTDGMDIHTKYALHSQKTEIELKQINDKFSEQVSLFKEHVDDDKAQNRKHLEILDKISMQVDKLNTKLDLSTQKIKFEIEKINKLDEEQNEQLRIHIEGVRTNKEALELYKKHHEDRLDDLEKPREWLAMTKKGAMWITAVSAGVGALLKLFGVI